MLTYNWSFTDYPTKNKYKVFGCFVCGGGSTMGYKLAGFNHLGGVEIDPTIAEVYKKNHNPKYFYNQDIRDFNCKTELPPELLDLDLLDGSPPCSSFSMAGAREKSWGKKKQFAEGQVHQVLDDLVFEYVKTIGKLKPKVFLLENVTGILKGNAVQYSKKIVSNLKELGYNTQVFQLNAASMGVPQKRERVFFIGHKKEFTLPPLKLVFNEKPITYKEIEIDQNSRPISSVKLPYWKIAKPGTSLSSVHPKGHFFNDIKVSPDQPLNTIASCQDYVYHYSTPRKLCTKEILRASSFPRDFNFLSKKPNFIMGMSVPPLMIARIAEQIKVKWLDVL